MKRMLATLTVLMVGCGIGWAQEVGTLRADSWYPYNGDPKAENPGYMVEVARLAFAKAGYQLDYACDG